MKQIKSLKSGYVNNNSHIELHSSILSVFSQNIASQLKLQEQRNVYELIYKKEESANKFYSTVESSKEIDDIDAKRKSSFRFIYNTITINTTNPDTQKAKSAEKLSPMAISYSKKITESTQFESSIQYDSFYKELNEEENKEDINTLEIGIALQNLYNQNAEYRRLYQERSTAKSTHQESIGSVTSHRPATDKAYKECVNAINALMNVQFNILRDQQQMEMVEKLIVDLNGVIDKFNANLDIKEGHKTTEEDEPTEVEVLVV